MDIRYELGPFQNPPKNVICPHMGLYAWSLQRAPPRLAVPLASQFRCRVAAATAGGRVADDEQLDDARKKIRSMGSVELQRYMYRSVRARAYTLYEVDLRPYLIDRSCHVIESPDYDI
jgi:hypothetical protein